ncbi:hypothetical protein BCR42DRAFT_413530 [Absidia repens]|uniref:AhpD-like protein n=1 Tax=Absidia repens TaxID=90262 RepID=A0A1X2IHQ1_9FUNG|nr:hypothetical protein BCR42DRAFT_413530 [Absidia repens]
MTLASLLSELPKLYKTSNINSESWYLAAAVVITTLNYPQDISQLYQQVNLSVTNMKDRETLILRLKEGIFKSSAIVGIPKVINALGQLQAAIPNDVKDNLPTSTIRPTTEWQDIVDQRQRGTALFNKIYDRHASRVLNNLEKDYPDLAQLALEDTYGKVLSNVDRVGALDTSFVVMAGLMVQDLPAQVKGHYYGAIHHGATEQQLSSLETIVENLCRFYNHQGYCLLPVKK